MQELVLIVWLADIVVGLLYAGKIVITVSALVLIASCIIASDNPLHRPRCNPYKFIKVAFISLVTSLLLVVVLPTKTTVYMYAAATAADAVYASNKPLVDKAVTLLEQRIDTEINKLTEAKK